MCHIEVVNGAFDTCWPLIQSGSFRFNFRIMVKFLSLDDKMKPPSSSQTHMEWEKMPKGRGYAHTLSLGTL